RAHHLILGHLRVSDLGELAAWDAETIVRSGVVPVPAFLSFPDDDTYLQLDCLRDCWQELRDTVEVLAGDRPDVFLYADSVGIRVAQFEARGVLDALIEHEDE